MVVCGKVPNQNFFSAMYSVCCCRDEQSNWKDESSIEDVEDRLVEQNTAEQRHKLERFGLHSLG